ncbi:MAG: hypothetical protein V1899_02235 [Planctomycetota bacterium]
MNTTNGIHTVPQASRLPLIHETSHWLKQAGETPAVRKNSCCSNRHAGIALIIVIAVLAGLMALAAPFVFSMAQHGRAARGDLNALQAREGADAAVAHALAQLHKTLRYNPDDKSPEITTHNDLKISMDFPAAPAQLNKTGFNPKNSNGLLWSARVEDEQGKININTAPPALIGNLLGSALLTDKVEKGSNILVVDDPRQFRTDRNSETVDGLVCIEGEILRYTNIQGHAIVLQNPTTQWYGKGSLVFDGRAKLIANYKFRGGGASFQPMSSLHEIKSAMSNTLGVTLPPDEFARIERQLTLCSGNDLPVWGHAVQPKEQTITSKLCEFYVENGANFTPGTLIRVLQGGQPKSFGRVRRIRGMSRVLIQPGGTQQSSDGSIITLEDDIGFSGSNSSVGSEFYIQPEMKHPINFNTASKETLQACFMGVRMVAREEVVTRQKAVALVEFLTAGGAIYTNHADLKKALDRAHNMGLLTLSEREAVFINASEPNSPKLGTSTVPFCYHSFGSYTIEGSGVVNSENGTQLARHTVRQLVTLPTPGPGRFKIEYQAGFEKLIEQGLTNRVVTFPKPMGKLKYKHTSSALTTKSIAAVNMGDVRLDVGETGAMGLPGEWIEHCNDEKDAGYRQDGYDLNRRAPFRLPPMINRNTNTVATQPTSVEMWVRLNNTGPCVFYDEGLEDDRNRATFLYDPRQGLVVRLYDATLGTTPSVPGATKASGGSKLPVECIYPVQLDTNEWYHVAASWKTGSPGGQEIRLDAQPTPSQRWADPPALKFKPGARLAKDLPAGETNALEVEELQNNEFPKKGALRIGEEIIEYGELSGNVFQKLNRGARLTLAVQHREGEWVVPYGFSAQLHKDNDLTVGGATLTERIDPANQTRTRVEVSPTANPKFVLDTETAKLPVSDTLNFPSSGFIVVGNVNNAGKVFGELIYYGKRSTMAFEKLVRAQSSAGEHGAVVSGDARNLYTGMSVELASIEISNSSNYDKKGIVQIDDEATNGNDDSPVEWIAYADKQIVNGKHYLLAELGQGIQNSIRYGPSERIKNGHFVWITRFRGGNFHDESRVPSSYFIRPNTAHCAKAKVIPVIRMEGPHCGGVCPLSGTESYYGDNGVSTVTIIERGASLRSAETRFVKQAYIGQFSEWKLKNPPNSCPVDFDHWTFHFYVGLDDFVSRRYSAANTRFLKWPSGELPDALNAPRHVCSDYLVNNQVHGHVDELRVNTHTTTGGRVALTTDGVGVQANAETIFIEDHDAWPVNKDLTALHLNWPEQNGGLVRIGDELLFFERANKQSVSQYVDVAPLLKNKDARKGFEPCQRKYLPKNNIKTKQVLALQKLTRGVLGTVAADHPAGAPAMLLDGMVVSFLKKPLINNSDSLTITNGVGFPQEGYALIGNQAYQGCEIVSYLKGGGSTTMTGINNFRGRYGTHRGNYDAGVIVRSLPFRYWDREGRCYDGDGLAFVEAGYASSDAVWDSIELVTKAPEERPMPNRVRPRLLVRFNGFPNWDVEPTNQECGLYEFRPKRPVLPLSGGIRADQIELRVYWEFMSGAFHPSPDWKRNYGIEKLRATYHSPLQMRRLDEIEKR